MPIPESRVAQDRRKLLSCSIAQRDCSQKFLDLVSGLRLKCFSSLLKIVRTVGSAPNGRSVLAPYLPGTTRKTLQMPGCGLTLLDAEELLLFGSRSFAGKRQP